MKQGQRIAVNFKKVATSLILCALFIIYSVLMRMQQAKTLLSATTAAGSPGLINNTALNSVANPQCSMQTRYTNGTYQGSIETLLYGTIQVEAAIHNGRISQVSFLSYPQQNSTSISINQRAMPILSSESIKSQCIFVNVVSGATMTSTAYMKSLNQAIGAQAN